MKKPSVLKLCKCKAEILSVLIVFVLYKKQKRKGQKGFLSYKKLHDLLTSLHKCCNILNSYSMKYYPVLHCIKIEHLLFYRAFYRNL